MARQRKLSPERKAFISGLLEHDAISHYRLDRMTDVIILDEKAKPQKSIKEIANGLNLPKHMAEHVYMYSGESIKVKFIANIDAMNDLIDGFGRDFTVLDEKEDKITVSLSCNEKAFVFWALQFDSYTEVLEPKDLREYLAELIKGMYDKYYKNT